MWEKMSKNEKMINSQIDQKKPYLTIVQHPVTTEYGSGLEQITNTLKVLGNLLGILNNSSQDYFQYDSSKKISNEDIELMIKERDQARLNKDFKKADLIREKLSSLNIALEDDGEKTIWKKTSLKINSLDSKRSR